MTFLFFIYLITQPALTAERKDNSLEYLAESLMEKSSANLTSSSFIIIQPNPQSCVRIYDFLNIAGIGTKFIVKNSTEDVLQSQVYDKKDLILVIGSTERFFKVYESAEFNNATTGTISPCQKLNQGSGYSIGLTKTNENIFEAKMLSLISNYSGLKNQLKISQGSEFNFSFTYSNGTEVPIQNRSQIFLNNRNIYAKSFPIVYINKEAITESGFLNVKIW